MQRKNKSAVMMLIMSIIFIVTSCGQKPVSNQETKASDIDVDINESDTETDISQVPVFSWNLYNNSINAGPSDENPLISPASAYIALAMAAEGAHGDTLAAFEEVLGTDAKALSTSANSLMKQLSEVSGKTTMNIANSMWLDHSININEEFREKLIKYFDADVFVEDFFVEDFYGAGIVGMINTWVAEETEGLIEQFIDKIKPDEVMMLINTLYMKASWLTPFAAELTEEKDFNLADGSVIKTEFLNSEAGTFTMIDSEEIEGVLLPYDDERLGFLALRPAGDSVDIRDMVLDATTINELVSGAENTENIVISMPKFELEYELSLVDILKNMGLSIAFDSEKADFSGLESDGSADLYISNVMQSAVIKVNELGTEAAASTSVSISRTSAPIGDPAVFSLDSPYVYAIIDLDTNIPLFIGILDTPQLTK